MGLSSVLPALIFLATATLSQASVIRRPHFELRSIPVNNTIANNTNPVVNTTPDKFIPNQSLLPDNNLLPRPDNTLASHVPIGAIINHCTVPGTVALTFDDGPYIYTARMLDVLAEHGAVATFFLNGVNKGRFAAFPQIVQRTINEGHQLGSHTWNHPYLQTLPYADIITQMTRLEEAFTSLLGFYPRYMRTPFLMFNDVVLTAMTDLGYHVIGASVDTKDYENDDSAWSWRSFEKFKAELAAGGNIVLAHDVHRTTVEVLVRNMLDEVRRRGLKTVTVGQCLDDPPELWYRNSR